MKKRNVFYILILIIIILFAIVCQIPSKPVYYVKEVKVALVRKATITKYAWTGNVMANGEYPYEGAVAVSDYSIPLGTKIEVNGKKYVVKDRTARWVHRKRGFTVDIYSKEKKGAMLAFGRRPAEIKFLTQ